MLGLGLMARLEQRSPSRRVQHHKSDNARLAEGRGERVWSSWTLALLIQEVLKQNQRDVTEADLRPVRSCEYLRVKLLGPTEQHHVARRMPPPHNDRKAWYYQVDPKDAGKLTRAEVTTWRANRPDDVELDRLVRDKTGRFEPSSERHQI